MVDGNAFARYHSAWGMRTILAVFVCCVFEIWVLFLLSVWVFGGGI